MVQGHIAWEGNGYKSFLILNSLTEFFFFYIFNTLFIISCTFTTRTDFIVIRIVKSTITDNSIIYVH